MKRCLYAENMQQATLAGVLDPTMKVMKDSNVDDYILHDLRVSQFIENFTMCENILEVIWRYCCYSKVLQRLKGVQCKDKHKIGTYAIYCPYSPR